MGMKTKESPLVINLAARKNKREQSCATIVSSLDRSRLKCVAGQQKGEREAREVLVSRYSGLNDKGQQLQEAGSLKMSSSLPLPLPGSKLGLGLSSGTKAAEAISGEEADRERYISNEMKDTIELYDAENRPTSQRELFSGGEPSMARARLQLSERPPSAPPGERTQRVPV
ncbi:hypothetical protein, partial [Paenibacillus bouchesdurhonensis]|uniref:hypothetical protein n=1 Tax=Paenibacillus bouchesdurhonensis TaxID=1870990 RepID=UPI001F2548E4